MLEKLKILSGIIIGAATGLITAYIILYFWLYSNTDWQNINYAYYCSDCEAYKLAPAKIDEPANLYAKYAALVDADTGNVLFDKNANEQVPMASTTKIMTCIVALENMSPDTICIASKYAASMPDVQLDLIAGEEFSLKDLLYALMLRSYNDCAVVIAENVAFSWLSHNQGYNQELYAKINEAGIEKIDTDTSNELVKVFAMLMNTKARELDCYNTYFITPNGLDASDDTGVHSTTATDLCHIMCYCIKNPDFLKITQASEYSFKSNKRSYSFTNANTFFQMMDGVISGKTGFTNDAGYCYVCALQSSGKTYVSAVLASGWPGNKTYKWLDTKQLMKYGINGFTKINIAKNIPSPSLLTLSGNREGYGISENYALEALLKGNEEFLYEYEIKDNGLFAPQVYLNVYVNERLVDSILL